MGKGFHLAQYFKYNCSSYIFSIILSTSTNYMLTYRLYNLCVAYINSASSNLYSTDLLTYCEMFFIHCQRFGTQTQLGSGFKKEKIRN